MIITAYILSAIVFFVLFTKYMKRRLEYIDKEDLFFLIFGSIFWPLVLVGGLVYAIFDWLEKVVNKS